MTNLLYDLKLGLIDSSGQSVGTSRRISTHEIHQVLLLSVCLQRLEELLHATSNARPNSNAEDARSTSHGNGATARGVERN